MRKRRKRQLRKMKDMSTARDTVFLIASFIIISAYTLEIDVNPVFTFAVFMYDICWFLANEARNAKTARIQAMKIREIRNKQIQEMWINDYREFRKSRVIDVEKYTEVD